MGEFLSLALDISYIGLLCSLALAFARLLIGPTLADRVVALELVGFLTIAFIAVFTIDTGVESFLDVAITLALTAFLSTIAFARFIMTRDDDCEEE